MEYFLALLVVYLAFCFVLAWSTVRPKLSKHTFTPSTGFKLSFENVAFRSEDGTRLVGWFMPAPKPRGVIVLCHGVDSSMDQMLWKANVFHTAGFATLVFDFRGRGESDGALCTIGYRETDDLLAAVKYVRGRQDMGGLPVGVFGESQGGAVALLGTARCQDIAAVAAESPFARLDHAVDNHFRSVFGESGALAARPVRWIGEALIHCRCCNVSPMDEIAKIAPRPLMLIQDESDQLCPNAETQELMKAAGEPKSLWSVPGAGHIESEMADPKGFTERVTAFFAQSLKR